MSTRFSSHTLLLVATLLLQLGCGSIREHRATSQLLLSDAVDRSVAKIDFSPLGDEKVFLDSRYLQFKNDSAVTTNYVLGSLRQQMVAAGCLLQDRIEDAKYVVEARVGTLGSDGHDINYGVPASNSLNTAASLISGSPALPALPEVSLARRTEEMAAVKIAAFAYDRESRMAVWQSGESLARSTATGAWILGAGPFKWGSIYDSPQFAGRSGWLRLQNPLKAKPRLEERDITYRRGRIWDPELRERVESGDQLFVSPAEMANEIETAEQPKQPSTEIAEGDSAGEPR